MKDGVRLVKETTSTVISEGKQNALPKTPYLVVPRVSSGSRWYQPEIIATDTTQIIPNASLYDFCVVNSDIHTASMDTVVGKQNMITIIQSQLFTILFLW